MKKNYNREDITCDFAGAFEKGLKVFYNQCSGCFEIENVYNEEVLISFYDEENEAGDESNGMAAEAAKKFIEEW